MCAAPGYVHRSTETQSFGKPVWHDFCTRVVLTYIGAAVRSRAGAHPYLLTPGGTQHIIHVNDHEPAGAMVLATAAYATLPLPSWCDVPAGALNSTGVTSKRNELERRSPPPTGHLVGRANEAHAGRAKHLGAL